jgi:adenosine deaminase
MKRLIAIILTAVMLFTMAGCNSDSTKYADKYIDLHLHLDGAITTEIAKKLADLQGITLPVKSDEELTSLLTVQPDCTSLNDFLECFPFPLSLLQTKEGLSEAAHLIADDIKSQGVIYAEFRFAPQLHLNKGMTQEDAIQAVIEGLKKSDLKSNIILCMYRGEDTKEANYETLELARKYLVEDGGVVAVDIAGAEALFPTSDYRDLFGKAKEYGIPFTIHAGEADGAESVKLAIEYGAVRIGHGTRSYESEEVMELLKEKNITLEMCPTSNRMTHAVEDMSKYPFMDYLNRGIKVTLNTDDMGVEGITLADEFRLMEKDYGLTPEQEKIILNNAIDAAFTTESVKEELRKMI